VRVVTQRNNQRLFRAAFSILKNRAEAEEAVQEAYLKAFAAMDGFAGRSSLSTWLTRIAINEALARARRAERRARIEEEHQLVNLDTYREKFMASSDSARSPEANVMRRQLAKLLERAIGNLPELFRPVFVLRDIEGLSVEETSEVLQIPRETVKTRLLRARRRLQQELDPELREALHDTFPFAGANCEALTVKVLARYLALPG
jgi:RNA polymerase sigma-70 factor (ECF subfamily)